MFGQLLKKTLKEAIKQSELDRVVDKQYIHLLGNPPEIDKDGNLIKLPKLPDIDNIDLIVRFFSNLSDK